MSNTLLKNIVLGSKTSNIFMLRCLSHFQTAPSAAVSMIFSYQIVDNVIVKVI